jgi:hypothetical protein
MKKRFTDCEIWGDVWYRRLPVEYKEFWRFVCEKSDAAGVWKVDTEAAAFFIGKTVDAENGLRLFNDGKRRLVALSGERWLLTGFIEFQYGTLSSECNAHKGVFADIQRAGLRLSKDGKRLIVPEDIEVPEPPAEPDNEASKAPSRPVEPRKASSAAALPEWLPVAPWAAFCEMRTKMRRPLTEAAKTLIFKRLDTFRAEGQDPEAVLNQSVMNSWQSVFPLKDRPQAGGAAPMSGKYGQVKRISASNEGGK